MNFQWETPLLFSLKRNWSYLQTTKSELGDLDHGLKATTNDHFFFQGKLTVGSVHTETSCLYTLS